MPSFTDPIGISRDPKTGLSILNREIRYHLGDKGLGLTVVVPKGFCTDWASIPLIAQTVIPKHGLWDAPALLHDRLYQFHIFRRRALADAVFLEAMTLAGVKPWRRWLIYLAVRAFGAKAFRTGPKRQRIINPEINTSTLARVGLQKYWRPFQEDMTCQNGLTSLAPSRAQKR